MAFSKSLPKAQVPLGCQLCESENRINFKCLDCNSLICSNCQKVHLKLAKEHRIVDVKSIQLPPNCQLCETSQQLRWRCTQCDMWICDNCRKIHLKIMKDHEIININDIKGSEIGDVGVSSKIGFKVAKKFTVDKRNIHFIAVCSDGSLWLGGRDPNYIQHIKLSGDKVSVLSTFDIGIFGLAISPTGSVMVITRGGSTIEMLNEKTGQLIDTKFTVHPWTLSCIHVTRDGNVILGGHKGGKGCVVVMNDKGQQLSRHENDIYNDKPLFTYPKYIVTTRNNNIFVAEVIKSNNRGSVVVIKQAGGNLTYTGHPDVNSDDKPFNPVCMVVTSRDNVIIVNFNTTYFHIINNMGEFITYYNHTDIGVILPYSLALSPSGTIYVGKVSAVDDPPDTKAILYELECSGV